jgi:hypothetical protein
VVGLISTEERFSMSKLDEKLAASEKRIADVQHQANDLKHAAQFRPSVVSDEDVSLAERLLQSWKTLRNSFSNHPEFRERARDLALKKATDRTDED